MPTTELTTGIPLPLYEEPPAIPDDLAVAVAALAGLSVRRYSSVAQRDALLTDPIDGMAAYITATATLYIRQGGAWRALWSSTRPAAVAALGTFSGPSIAAGATAPVDITFPAGRFLTPPNVHLIGHTRHSYGVGALTKDGCTVTIANYTSATAGVSTVRWTALEVA